jgi:hypothetical protein
MPSGKINGFNLNGISGTDRFLLSLPQLRSPGRHSKEMLFPSPSESVALPRR